jgi:hypothetical protein
MKMPRILWIVALCLTLGVYLRPAVGASSLSKGAVSLQNSGPTTNKADDDKFKAPKDKDKKSKTKPDKDKDSDADHDNGQGNDDKDHGNGNGNNGNGH